MKSDMVWVCVVESPSTEQERMVLDVVEGVERSSVRPRSVDRVELNIEVRISDRGVAYEVYYGFVEARDTAGSKREYNEFDEVVGRFVREIEASALGVELEGFG